MKTKKIIHILMTDYSVDSRVHNETTSLQKKDYEVNVFCLKSQKFNDNEYREDVFIQRFGLGKAKILKFLSAYLFMFFKSFRQDVDLVHAHDVTALPIAYLIAKIKRVPFVYDSHELWSQSHHASSSKFLLSFVAFMERFFAKRTRHIITVSQSIQEYMKSYFKNENISLLRNIPSYTHEGEYNIFREKYAVLDDETIFLYQGLMSESRGVGLIVDTAISLLKKEPHAKFFFLGEGDALVSLKEKVREENLEKHIFFLGQIAQSDLLKYTKSADIGIHAIHNSCLNHDYCLPNKLFEYIHSDLVVVMTGLTELSAFIHKYEIGLTFEDKNASSLEEKLLLLLKDKNLYHTYKDNVQKLSRQITWENEALLLLKVYKNILEIK